VICTSEPCILHVPPGSRVVAREQAFFDFDVGETLDDWTRWREAPNELHTEGAYAGRLRRG